MAWRARERELRLLVTIAQMAHKLGLRLVYYTIFFIFICFSFLFCFHSLCSFHLAPFIIVLPSLLCLCHILCSDLFSSVIYILLFAIHSCRAESREEPNAHRSNHSAQSSAGLGLHSARGYCQSQWLCGAAIGGKS